MNSNPSYANTGYTEIPSQYHPSTSSSPLSSSTLKSREKVLFQLSDSLRANAAKVHQNDNHDHHHTTTTKILSSPSKFQSANDFMIQMDLSHAGLLSMDAKLIQIVLLQNTSLQVIKLDHNQLRDEGLIILSPTIGNHLQLSFLDIAHNVIGDTGCQNLIQALTEKKDSGWMTNQYYNENTNRPASMSLNLSGNLITDAGAHSLAALIKNGDSCQLSSLHLTGNRIGTEGIQSVTNAIVHSEESHQFFEENYNDDINDKFCAQTDNCKSSIGMQELYLGKMMGNIGLDIQGCEAVARMLEVTTSLQVLSLTECNIGDTEVNSLAQCLTRNRHRLILQSLRLSHNNLTCDGVETLMNALWGSESLRELRLDHNLIGDFGSHLIAALLSSRSTIEILDIGFNSITSRGLKSIFHSIANNEKLISLSVSGNHIDKTPTRCLQNALAINTHLQSINLDQCSVDQSCQTSFVTAIVSNSKITLSDVTGFLIAPIVVSIGFPTNVGSWTNKQVLRFLRYIWENLRKENVENLEMDIDDLDSMNSQSNSYANKIINDDLTREMKIKEVCYGAMVYLDEFGIMEKQRFASQQRATCSKEPLVLISSKKDSVESIGSMHRDTFGIFHEKKEDDSCISPTLSVTSTCSPFMNLDNQNWISTHFCQLRKMKDIPFDSGEMEKLYEHFFTPSSSLRNEMIMTENGSLTWYQNNDYFKEKEGNVVPQSSIVFNKCIEMPLQQIPSQHKSFMATTNIMNSGMLSTNSSHKRNGTFLDSQNTSSDSFGASSLSQRPSQNGSYVPSMWDQKELNEQPTFKRMKRNPTRISHFPRIKAKLDVDLEQSPLQALILLRQLKYMECNFSDVNQNFNCYGLSGVQAIDAEEILLDLLQ